MIQEHPVDLYVQAVRGRKAGDIVVLDVARLTSYADFFIICTGHSSRQVNAISEFVHRDLRNRGIRPLSIEGEKEGQWAVLDYGHVVIHVFSATIRTFYNLEGLWSDAPRVPLPAPQDLHGEIAPGRQEEETIDDDA